MRKGKLLLNLDFANLYSIFYCCLCAFLKAGITVALKLLKLVLQGCEETV